jgi:REP element-mobilizing transposase RayT
MTNRKQSPLGDSKRYIMVHSYVELYFHLIFSTKNRAPLISSCMEQRLYGYLTGIAKQRSVLVLKINGVSDHVHLLLKMHASVPLSVLVKELKSYSSGWMKKEGVRDFGWQNGYGAFSCSITHIPQLIKYIENQKEHHKVHSFEQEIETINKYWNIQWSLAAH